MTIILIVVCFYMTVVCIEFFVLFFVIPVVILKNSVHILHCYTWYVKKEMFVA